MKTVTIKVNNASETLEEVTLKTKTGDVKTIKARPNVNYEFFEHNIDRAPNHIVSKRVDNDLHVSFENEGVETNLIIEDFYDYPEGYLIGQAENSQYYYYIPDTGETYDLTNNLLSGDVEGQALGGEPMIAPWWLGATPSSSGIFPILGGILGVGAVAAVLGSGSNSSAAEQPAQSPPSAQDDGSTDKPAVTLDENTTTSINILSNDSDPDGDTLSVTRASSPNGTVVIKPDGSLEFTPNKDFVGDTTITYTISDGNGGTDTATVYIKVNNTNQNPTATDNTKTTDEDTPASGNVLTDDDGNSNDSDADGDTLAVTDFTVDGTTYKAGDTATLTEGTLVINADGSYTFTPADNYSGTVPAITYTVSDGKGGSDTAQLTIKVNAVNDAPVADPASVTPTEDTPVGIPLTGSDVDGTVASVTITQAPDATQGTLTYDDDGDPSTPAVPVPLNTPLTPDQAATVQFEPAPNYVGPVDDVIFTVADNEGATSEPATITINDVVNVNDAPVANDDALTTTEDTPATGNVLTKGSNNPNDVTDTDVDGDTLAVTDFTVAGTTYNAGDTANIPSVGQLTLNADGSYTFTPAPDYSGQVPVTTYTVTDNNNGSDTATLTINVTPVNDAPVVSPIESGEKQGNSITFSLVGSDVDSNIAQYTIESVPDATTEGTLKLSDGTAVTAGQTLTPAQVQDLVFEPVASYFTQTDLSNAITFTYTATDDDSMPLTSSAATVTLLYDPVNTPPKADDKTFSTDEDKAVATDLTTSVLDNTLSGETETQAADLTYKLNTLPPASQGVFTLDGNPVTAGQTLSSEEASKLVFTPATNFSGGVTVAFTVTDNGLVPDGPDADTDPDQQLALPTTATVTINVAGVNDAPVADPASVTPTEDTPVGIPLTGSDVDGTVASVTITQAPDATQGTLTYDDDGDPSTPAVPVPLNTPLTPDQAATVQFEPAPNYVGPVDDVIFTVTDNEGATSEPATVTINDVVNVNDAPKAQADTNIINEDDAPVTGNVITNDSDIDTGDSLTVSGVATGTPSSTSGNVASDVTGTYGKVQIAADGAYTYTLDNSNPTVQALAVGETLTDTFTYTVTDSAGATATTTLTITINGVNDAPIISVQTGDSDSAALDETNADLTASGTLTLADVDTTDVVSTSVEGVKTSGTFTGTLPSDADLLTMLNVTGDLNDSQTNNTNGINWEFGSGSQAFDNIPKGETLILTYTIRATDDNGATTSKEVTITITGTNDVPVATNNTKTTNEDTPVSGNVISDDDGNGVDTDPDGDTLTISSATVDADGDGSPDPITIGGSTIIKDSDGKTIGTLELADTGAYTFTPGPNYNGTVPAIEYTVSDGNGGTATATLNITVDAVQDPPVAVDDGTAAVPHVTMDEDTTEANINILGNDTDPDGDPLTVTAATSPDGAVNVNPDGTLSFTPNPNFNGNTTISYTISDGNGGTDTATVYVTVSPVNDAVLAVDDNNTVAESVNDPAASIATGNVRDNDTDIDNTTPELSVTGIRTGNEAGTGTDGTVGSALNGTYGNLVIKPDGSYEYQLDNSNSAVDALVEGDKLTEDFTYTISDGDKTDTATLTITITGTNDAPVAKSDIISPVEETPTAVPLVASDVDGTVESITLTQIPTATQGTITYTEDGTGNTITVTAANLSDSLSPAEAATVTFTPTTNYNGEVTPVKFTATDNLGKVSEEATVLINDVTAVNDAPVATDNANSVSESDNDPATSTVSGNLKTDATADSDVDNDIADLTVTEIRTGDESGTGNAGTISSSLTGTYGSITVNPDGTYTYQLDNTNTAVDALKDGETLTEQFTYTISDGDKTDKATLTITINGTNDAPVAVSDTVTTTEDAPVAVPLVSSDVDGTVTSLTITSIPQASEGKLTYDDGTGTRVTIAAGDVLTPAQAATVQFEPTTNYTGPVSNVTFTATDNNGAVSDPATITFDDVGAVNDPPVATDDVNTVAESTNNTGATTITGNVKTDGTPDSDVDTPLASLTVDTIRTGNEAGTGTSGTVSSPLAGEYGTLTIQPDGSYSYDLNNTNSTVDALKPGETLTEEFTYTIDDGDATDTATLTITITGTNDAPVAKSDSISPTEETPISVPLVGTDVDGTIASFTLTAIPTATQGTITYTEDGTGNTITVTAANLSDSLSPAEAATLTFTPATDYNGPVDPVTYTVTDNLGAISTPATITIDDVAAVNDAPVATDNANSVNESANDPSASTVSGNLKTDATADSDVDNDIADLTVTEIRTGDESGTGTSGTVGSSLTGTYGSIVVNSDGTYTYQLDNANTTIEALTVGQTLTETFTYTISDGDKTDTATLTITINGTNDAPVANVDENRVIEDAADSTGNDDGSADTTIVNGNVTSNDEDVDTGDTLNVTGIEAGTPASASGNIGTPVDGTYGRVTLAANGEYTYALDNTKPEVQALAAGETVTDTFTYTLTDAQGETTSTTLTITVEGTNDAPDITLQAGDTDAASLTETTSPLTTTGTLSLADIDTIDTVSTAVTSVTTGGTYTGPLPTNADLLNMMGVTGGLNNTQQSVNNGINWNFDSGTQVFDFLPQGQTLELTYVITATDGQGETDTQTVTITITGTNNTAEVNDDTSTGLEDTAQTGNVLSNDKADADNGETLSVTQFSVDANGDGTIDASETFTADGNAIILTSASGGTIGSFSLTATGDYTFTPQNNYSGPVPTITYTATNGVTGPTAFTDTADLNISITPVADGVTWNNPSPSSNRIRTPEDTRVALGIKVPTLNDNTDENGTQTGDHGERMQWVTIGGLRGAQIYKADGTLLDSGGKNFIRVIIVDSSGNIDTSLHHTDVNPPAGTYQLTRAEFEALELNPIAHTDADSRITFNTRTYETDDAGNRDNSVPFKANSRSVRVIVEAVTDPVELKINGADTYAATLNEDTPLDVAALLSANFEDVDGSEDRDIVISNPAGNDAIIVNGTTVAGGESITIQAPDLSTSTTDFPAISITPANNVSGNINGIEITLQAQDNQNDPDGSPATQSDTVTLDLTVNPVADDVVLNNSTTTEDTAVTFLSSLAPTDTTGTTESINTVVINDIPDGWVLKDHTGNIVATGDGTNDVTIDVTSVGLANVQNYTLTPPAHSSADATLSIDVTTQDGADIKTFNKTPKVTVTPVAEVIASPTSDTDGNSTADLTMNGDFAYTSTGTEDQFFKLNTDGFDFKAPWKNEDTVNATDNSEKTFALLTPKLVQGGTGDSVIGSEFKYTDGGVETTVVFTGEPVEIPIAALDTVEFKAPQNVAGEFEIQVQARTKDTDPDTGEVVTTDSGSATLNNIIIEPDADVTSLAVNSPVVGNEDTSIPLVIKPSSSDPSETFNVTIEDIPAGSVLTYDGTVLDTSSGTVTIDNFDTSKPLTIQPVEHSNNDFTLNVSAVSVDEITIDGTTYTDTSDPTSKLSIDVKVKGVADPVNVVTNTPTVTEAVNDNNDNAISLGGVFDSATLVDTDGSESLSFVITGLDPQFSVQGLEFVGGTGTGRKWAGTLADIQAATVTTPEHYSGTIGFSYTAVTTENDGNSLTSAAAPVSIQVTPSPETTINNAATVDEDTITQLDFSLQPQDGGDANETLSSVWIEAASLTGKPFELFLDAAGTTSISTLTPNADGYYEVDPASVYIKGAANSDADTNFNVRYGITDPSNDGSITAVTQQFDTAYEVTVTGVTDQTASTNDHDNTTVYPSGTASVTVNVTVTQQPDSNANNSVDTDGSENLTKFFIDKVPDGVSVVGGTLVGPTPGFANQNQWVLDVRPDASFNSTSVTQPIEFKFDGNSSQLSSLNQDITITSFSQDTESNTEVTSTTTWTLKTDSNFTPGGSSATPASIADWSFNNTGMTEDAPTTLNTLMDAKITGSSPFSITLTDLPEGTVVTGMVASTVDGKTVWTASGNGGDADLQTLLDSITITLPEHLNDNKGALNFNAKLNTFGNGTSTGNEATAALTPETTPVSDPMELTTTAQDIDEDTTATISIDIANAADGSATNIVDGKLYVKIDESGMGEPGSVSYDGNTLTPTAVSGVAGVPDGNYYVVSPVANDSTVNLSYKPAANDSGKVSYQAYIQNQETGASNIETSDISGSFAVNKVNETDVNLTLATTDVNVAEDSPAVLPEISVTTTDSSEELQGLIIGNIPDGYLVNFGSAAPGALATNLGGGEWSIPTSGGTIPSYIAIIPPEHVSASLTGVTVTALTGETGQEPVATTETINVTINPVADGITINPTRSFGNEGDIIALNLNSSLQDADGSETVNLTIEGLGSNAAFYNGTTLLNTTYDSGSDTYTFNGLTLTQVENLGVVQKDGNYTLNYTASTTDGSDTSATVSGSGPLEVKDSRATSGDDSLMFHDEALNGRAGNDTIYLRANDNLDSSDVSNITNIEAIDLSVAGDHTVDFSLADMVSITDNNNVLTLTGDAGDTVNVNTAGWTEQSSTSSGGSTQYVYQQDGTSNTVTFTIQDAINTSIM